MSSLDQIPSVPEVDVVTAWEMAREHTSYIVDVREADELTEISVPSAIHIPLGSLHTVVRELPRDRALFVLCHSGVRSAYATQFLLASGFDDVKNITGGVVAWAQAQLPYMSYGYVFNDKHADSRISHWPNAR